MIQPGTHPDAEVLTAFAERALSDGERNDVLAHMTTCGRCREVVFLAQKSMEAEEPVRPAGPVSEPKTSGGWFSGWRWSWVPVAALAGVVGFAVIRHMERGRVSETRMAQNVAPSDVVESRPSAKATATAPAEQKTPRASREESKPKSAIAARSDREVAADLKSLEEKDRFAAQKKDEAGKERDALSAAAFQDSAGTVHGTLGARAKSSSVGGPMAQNQVQQQNSAQLQQNYANANEDRQAATVLADSANKPVVSADRPKGLSQTATVDVASGPLPVSPAPAAAPAMIGAQAASESVEVSGRSLEKRKAAHTILPSKLAASSEAISGERIAAIDSAGSLFVSEDAGKHWKPINAQWSGRAVLVRTAPPAMGAVGGLLKQSIARFELTTDTQEIWVSEDGKNWTHKAGK